jgi:DNA-binding response OmpR family regulator
MKQKILAIDDSLTLREFIQRSLARQSADYQIILAKDGTEGLALAVSEQPDLILLDFVLPDMKGDEVCRRLLSVKKTAGLPVVLMSSSAADIKRTQGEYENVIKSIPKPFTPDLLCSTVAHSLRETSGKTPLVRTAIASAPVAATRGGEVPAGVNTSLFVRSFAKTDTDAKPGVTFAGDTGQFSMISVLLALEQDQLTGMLKVSTGGEPMELHVVSGRPVLVTSRDAAAYFRNSGHHLTIGQTQVAETVGNEQAKTGAPVFMQFAEQKLMPLGNAVALSQQQSLRLISQVWTAPRTQFKFESGTLLPPLTSSLPPFEGTMSEWAMESLRFVGDDFRAAMAWGEPTGIPAYTRKGYERIQLIPLNDEELAFAGLISPTNSLEKIAAGMRTDVDSAQRILHRFLCLEIFDYWPASLLQAA